MREIFRKAKGASPSIIFFVCACSVTQHFFFDDIPFLQDEIDALASPRAADGDNSTHEGVITSLLNEMDGVQELQGVTIIAATNRPEIIVCKFASKRYGI